MPTLVPEYLQIDFNTLVSRLKDQIKSSDIFRDTDYEGANVTLIAELMAYIGELQTFYTNKVAKNIYMETADIYENVHRLATLIGYDPKGHRGARGTCSVTVSAGVTVGDILNVDAWQQIESTQSDPDTGEAIQYATTESYTLTATEVPYQFDIFVRQGEVLNFSYTGDDIVSNEILLPLGDYGYDDSLIDENNTIEVRVDGVLWTRVSDFFDLISGLQETRTVYKFEYDKYQRYKIVFSALREVPNDFSTIEITCLRSLGENSGVGPYTLTGPQENFVYNTNTMSYLDNSTITMTNSAATIGAANPEPIDTIKDNAQGQLHAQFRNVTAIDYITNLSQRSDIVTSNVWGEQEVAPSGDTSEYNKVHITVYPNPWGSASIETSAASGDNGVFYTVPYNFTDEFKTDLSEYLEARKILTVYEQYELPILIYFRYDVGIRVGRTYSYAAVRDDVRSKLIYYFDPTLRNFNEQVNFRDLEEFILDRSIVSEGTLFSAANTFPNIAGVRNLIFRDIDVQNAVIYEPNPSMFPRYIHTPYVGDNKLRTIELGFTQFPAIDSVNTRFSQEV